jgi:probable HAF family extracellular repeat protein
VGESDTDSGRHAFGFSDDKFADLGTLGESSGSVAYAVNAGGVAVGSTGSGPTVCSAFIKDEGDIADIGSLADGHMVVIAYGINDAGAIVGVSGNGDAIQLAFIYADQKMTPLGTLGGPTSIAYGINSKNWIVGQSQTADGAEHAFIYKDGVMTDLNSQIDSDSGWTLHVARGLNESGQIVGWGILGGHTHAFLLTPKDQ